MDFLCRDYLITILTFLAVVSILPWIITYPIYKGFRRKKLRFAIQLAPFIVALLIFIAGIGWALSAISPVLHLFLEQESDAVTVVTQIQQIRNSNAFPLYYCQEQHTLCRARWLQTNHGDYYVISTGNLQPNDYVSLKYLPQSRAVLQWRSLSVQEAQQFMSTPQRNAITDADHSSRDFSGNYILGSFFLAMLLLFLLDFFGESYIQGKLWDSDVLTTQEVRPRVYGIVTRCGGIAVLAAFCIVSLCTHNDTLSCLFAVASIVFGSSTVSVFRIRIQYDEKAIFFKSGKQIQQIPVESLQRIQWEEVRRTTGFSLVLYFWGGGKIILQQSNFIGLRAMAEYYNTHPTQDTASQ